MAKQETLQLVVKVIDSLRPDEAVTFDKLSFANRIGNLIEFAMRFDDHDDKLRLAISVLEKVKDA